MPAADEFEGASLIATLNDLLQLDHDAVQAYTIAIDLVREPRYRDSLVEFRGDHKRHIEELADLVRKRGGLPTELPHPTGPLKLAVQSIGGIMSDDALLLAFKAVEGQVRDKYQRATRAEFPAEVAAVVQVAFSDEDRHYRWVERTLTERGVGAGSLQHGLVSVVERVHKVLADTIEGIERTVMDTVGSAVGGTQRRGGSEAPSTTSTVDTSAPMGDFAADAMRGAASVDPDLRGGSSGLGS